ncbi:uncharacterized protein LOC143199543 [Rhynchophorus ferrugineus]|uniref:uncharacterized protein LOC143199543 n=1 Tax=Rhynchophorus ferrugineus TaxID=354439 RepID=UPI003FCC985B
MLDITTLTNILKKQCEDNDASRIIWTEIDRAKVCLAKIKFLSTPKEDFITTFKNCSRNIVPAMETCLTKETKYYPDFFFQIMESFMAFVYDHIHLFKITSDNAILYCLQRLKYEKGLPKIRSCLSNNTSSLTTSNFPTKNQVCHQMSQYIRCVSEIVSETCSRDILIDQVLADAKRATEGPCQ